MIGPLFFLLPLLLWCKIKLKLSSTLYEDQLIKVDPKMIKVRNDSRGGLKFIWKISRNVISDGLILISQKLGFKSLNKCQYAIIPVRLKKYAIYTDRTCNGLNKKYFRPKRILLSYTILWYIIMTCRKTTKFVTPNKTKYCIILIIMRMNQSSGNTFLQYILRGILSQF